MTALTRFGHVLLSSLFCLLISRRSSFGTGYPKLTPVVPDDHPAAREDSPFPETAPPPLGCIAVFVVFRGIGCRLGSDRKDRPDSRCRRRVSSAMR